MTPARADTLKAAVALPEIWIAYDLGGGGYETAIAKILTAHAAEAVAGDRASASNRASISPMPYRISNFAPPCRIVREKSLSSRSTPNGKKRNGD